MGYILIEESLFKKLMGQLFLDEDIADNKFSEKDYWISTTEACQYLNVSKSMIYAYRRANLLFYLKFGDTYRYKRSDVYKLKTQMDAELIESGRSMKCRTVVNTEQEALDILEKEASGITFDPG